jgi:pyruvate carboxylase
VLGKTKPAKERAQKIDLDEVRAELATKLKREPTEDDLYSYLMYPGVFADFWKITREFGDVSKLPTPAFFYGLKSGEEIAIDIEQGKTLFVKLINVGDAAKDGRRIVSFEFNGMPREATAIDRSLKTKSAPRPKADASKSNEVGAPIPGMVSSMDVGVGARVMTGDKILTLEAMKMQTTLYAPTNGVIGELFAKAGDAVDTGDLLVRLKE